METEIIKSPNDTRQYRTITLENHLQVLLISDVDTKQSAAALQISIGMLNDPKEYQGLAHFLEHMLFMGSSKYPAQNDYSAFVQANAGETNASTWLQSTKYYFSTANLGFLEALDRFAQFFISPLFTESCVQREINAVESEFNLSLADDSCRMWEIYRQQANENSTFNTFGCGNLKSLQKPDIRDQLIKFYNQYYCASLMRLVIYSDKSIAELSQIATDIFKHVPFRNVPKPIHNDNPFQGKTAVQIRMVSVMEEDELCLSFPIKNYKQFYKYKPVGYLSHLLGHEGKNSLTSFLVDEGLINELTCGQQDLNDSTSEFYIYIKLTEEGLEQYQKVVGFVFKYIQITRDIGPQQWIYDELREINETEFKYMEKSSVLSFTQKMCRNMHHYDIQDIIQADFQYNDFNKQYIQEVLDALTPQNLILILRSPEFAKQATDWLAEPNCLTKYLSEPLSKDIFSIHENCMNLQPEITNKSLGMPIVNPYIPRNFELLNGGQAVPSIIAEDELIQVYHKQDDKFKICKSSIGLQIYPNQQFVSNAKERVMSDIWMNVFSTYFDETSYEAECAAMDYSLSVMYNKIKVSIDGFSDSLPKFYLDFVDFFHKFHTSGKDIIKQHIFEAQFDKVQDRYDSYFLKSPYDLTFSYMKCILYKSGKFMKEQLKDIDVTFPQFLKFTKNFMSNMRVEMYIHGNISKESAMELYQQTKQKWSTFTKPNTAIIPQQILLVQPGVVAFQKTISNPEEPNSGIIVHFQGHATKDPIIEYQYDLLSVLMADPVENQLRTNEQLGYVVYSNKVFRRGVFGINIVIISQIKSPNQLALRIDAFLEEYIQTLQNLDITAFNQAKDSFLQEQSQDYQNSAEQFRAFNHEIQLHTYDFNKKQLLQERISAIKFEEFKQFAVDFFRSNRRLEIHVLNPKHSDQDKEATRGQMTIATQRVVGEYNPDLFMY